ncbi:MAG: hypothetical protein QW182_01030 [Thermosphaera sp.]
MLVEDNLPSLIVWVATSALLDSIDPCFYALYVSIMLSTSLTDLRRILKNAGFFLTSAYFGYLLLGLLLRSLTSLILVERWHMGLILIAYGGAMIGYTILFSKKVLSEEVCRDDRLECRLVRTLKITRSLTGPYLILLGLLASLTILPCSAGLYVVYVILTTRYEISLWLPLTAFYVLVFISPLVALTFGIVGVTRIKIVFSTLLRHEKIFKIIGGLLAIIVGLYLSLTS